MTDKVRIKEIFTSVQGEGPFIGYKQLFIRFCGCNLTCQYCDTDWTIDNSIEYSISDVLEIVNQNKDCHSLSLTGGEPLLNSGFLKEFLPQCPIPVYLETNATLAGELSKIIDYIDYVSADIKLPSCTGSSQLFNEHDDFLQTAMPKLTFAKIVFDNNITQDEIDRCCKLGAKYNIELVLQPRMQGDFLKIETHFIETILDKFLEKYKKVRLIPQTHKFLNIR